MDSIELDPLAVSQLREFITTISTMHRDHEFHNFEHASHVTQSVTKLLNRVSVSDDPLGISADPLIGFACVFAALIHDVDHPGVSNVQLVEEGTDLAQRYHNQSIAEQNSVDLGWETFMDPSFSTLRRYVYTTQAELDRFRQLVVNAVMATDVMDQELAAWRRERWEQAFEMDGQDMTDGKYQDSVGDTEYLINLQATVILEHLVQASDVAHTMQHWNIYRKWNERLFCEMFKAFKNGRADKDPSEGWYQGELKFFDFYVIPLAKKLKSSGVFGVASDEYLTYAITNREEWELRGQALVDQYKEEYNQKEVGDEEWMNSIGENMGII